METNVLDDQLNNGPNEVGLNYEGLQYLEAAGKWGKFLSILGFIFCGLMVVIGLFAASVFSTLTSTMSRTKLPMNGFSGLLTFIYVIMAVIYFYPCLTLYRFSSNAISAASSKSSEQITLALKNLKSNFRFVGILTIVILGLYVLILVLALLSIAMR